ncbi:MAG: GC-type dockerin domain-anchored protein [Phycisphaerales bacterium]
MKTRTLRFGALTTAAGLAVGMASGAQPLFPPVFPATPVVDETAAQHLAIGIESALFASLPVEQRAAIAAGLEREEAQRLESEVGDIDYPATDENYAKVAHVISREKFEQIRPIHRKVLVSLAEHAEKRETPVAACFAPGTDPELAMAVSELIYHEGLRFQQTGRWTSTALSGGGLGQGDPTIITYGFVPDGTFVPDAVGIGVSGNSQLFAWLNGIYGSPATWQPLFDQVFARWAELSGASYVYEPNDDGVNLNGAAGVAGVRADCRISAIPIDGNSGILAYNNFPQDGDMVLDAFDSFFSSIGNNSRRLRNVVAHEHGHGCGMLHVCPANGTKLMEPFIDTSYDGPQLDDILNAQRHYGDDLEDNDSPGEATALGALGVIPVSITQVSIDDNSDLDYYSFNIADASEVTAVVTPTGSTYTQGPQTSQCNTGSSYNSLTVMNLGVQIIDSNGVTVLGSSDVNGAGQSENLAVVIENPGTYYVRVDGDNTNSIQAYNLAVLAQELPFLPLGLSLVDAIPNSVDSGETFDLTIHVNPRDEVVAPGSAMLFFRNDGGSFSATPMSPIGGNDYSVTVPASLCGTDPEFYFQVTGDLSGAVTLPDDAPAELYSTVVGQFVTPFADNFETDMGWTVSGDITTGASGMWQRGTPLGGGDRGDPADDADGSGQCYVTGINDGNTDVDGGTTILTSPAFDAGGNDGATISFYTWYNNAEGGAPNADTMLIEISDNNGASWTTLEVIGPAGAQTSGGWFFKTFTISDFVAPSSQVRVRFSASDLGTGSLVEAGVDGVTVNALNCMDPENMGCNAADLAEPFDTLDFSDVLAFLAAFAGMQPEADLAAPMGVFDFSDVVSFLAAFGGGCP